MGIPLSSSLPTVLDVPSVSFTRYLVGTLGSEGPSSVVGDGMWYAQRDRVGLYPSTSGVFRPLLVLLQEPRGTTTGTSRMDEDNVDITSPRVRKGSGLVVSRFSPKIFPFVWKPISGREGP